MKITLTDRELRMILRLIADRAFVILCSMALALLFAKARAG